MGGWTDKDFNEEFYAEDYVTNDISKEEVLAIRAAWNFFKPEEDILDINSLKRA